MAGGGLYAQRIVTRKHYDLDGAKQAAEEAPGPVDAVIVLGDLATERLTKPFVIPWSTGRQPAPMALERTLQDLQLKGLDVVRPPTSSDLAICSELCRPTT